MKRHVLKFCFGLLILLFGCAQVPKTVIRPWKRTLSEMQIAEGSRISIVVECEETPFLGSDHLVNSKISSTATDLLDIPYQLSRPFRFLRAMCPKIRAAHSEIESQ
jgi:hypothetical protein